MNTEDTDFEDLGGFEDLEGFFEGIANIEDVNGIGEPKARFTHSQFVEATERFREEFLFEAGKYMTFRVNDVSVVVCPVHSAADPSSAETSPQPGDGCGQHLITIFRGLVPPAEVQDLPCGIVNSDGRLVWTAATDCRGQFQAMLPPGKYGLRCVLDITAPVDVDILDRVGDPTYLPMLADVMDDPAVALAIKDRIKEVAVFLSRSSRKSRHRSGDRWHLGPWTIEVFEIQSLAAAANLDGVHHVLHQKRELPGGTATVDVAAAISENGHWKFTLRLDQGKLTQESKLNYLHAGIATREGELCTMKALRTGEAAEFEMSAQPDATYWLHLEWRDADVENPDHDEYFKLPLRLVD
jgi:hypothetical protein